MKLKKYIASLASLLLLATGFTACQDDFDATGIDTVVYHAKAQANTSILELKTMYWRDDTNFCDTITPYTAEQQQTLLNAGITPNADRQIGDPIVVKGRVISSDYTGNLYKVLVIQDETAAISISIDHSGLFAYYPQGQEIVLSLDGRVIGKYAELMMLGRPEYTTSYGWQTGRMALNFFQEYAEKNGAAYTVTNGVAKCNLASSDTTLVANIGELVNNFGTPAGKIQWQSRLVRINNVWFTEGGQATFAEKEVTTKRYVTDDNGNELMVYNSGYADFWAQTLPAGRFDIVGIISYYNSTPQLLLLDTDGCMNVGNPTQEGTKDVPYTVAQAIKFASAGSGTSGWVGGYIVGTVAPEVTSVQSNSDITWSAPFVMDNTLVLADDAACRDYSQCVIIRLPEGSSLYEKGNLADNASNLGKFAAVKGTVTQVLNAPGVTGFKGYADDSYIDGVEIASDGNADGDGSEATPYQVTQVLNLGNPGTTAWVTGYIVGWVEGQVYSSGCHFDASATSQTNILLAADASETDNTKCIPVQLPTGDVRTALNLQSNPGNLGKKVSLYGSLEKYFGQPGLKTVTQYTIDGSSSGSGNTGSGSTTAGSGDGSESSPYNVAAVQGLGNPGSEAWVGGYIIGTINADSNYAVETSAPFNYAANILLADSPEETSSYIAIQLPYGDVRTALNLKDNPGNLGKYLKVYGTLSSYLQTNGVKSVSKYDLEGGSSSGSGSGSTTTAQAGTQEDPYTIASVLALNNPGTISWATGYIVGWVSGQVYDTGCTFAITGEEAQTNVLLADSPLEVNSANCVPVQLPSGTVRAGVNLKDNPGNFGKKITVNGTLSAYFGRVGIKTVTEYAF